MQQKLVLPDEMIHKGDVIKMTVNVINKDSYCEFTFLMQAKESNAFELAIKRNYAFEQSAPNVMMELLDLEARISDKLKHMFLKP